VAHRIQFEQWVSVPLARAFLFFANPGNLPRIMPPQTGTELVRLKLVPPPGILEESATVTDEAPLAGVGSEIVTSFRVVPFLPFRRRWTALITEFEWNHHFADVQKQGPFKSFHHRHELAEETWDSVCRANWRRNFSSAGSYSEPSSIGRGRWKNCWHSPNL
jgi:ligand-binding SRPBCC domain-containing protein